MASPHLPYKESKSNSSRKAKLVWFLENWDTSVKGLILEREDVHVGHVTSLKSVGSKSYPWGGGGGGGTKKGPKP